MTIPIIKAIAALIATATLGTGVTGTATAAGLTDTRTDAAATTVTSTADTSSLPDHLINGTFDYPTCPGGKASCDVDPTTGWGGFYKDFGGDNKFAPIDNWDRSKFGWDSDQEGMRPDQQPTSHQKLQHCVQLGHANNNNGQKVNRYAEIIAETPTGAIYQDIATVPGVMYRWTLKHASASTSHADSMAVMIGDPGKETAQEATRTTVNGYGDKLGKVGTTITTKGPGVAWETYTGTYIATSTVTRFTYRSLQGDTKLLHTGNWIDDVSFDKAYKLTYDKNASDATGQVPSDQYGKENTTQPAKTNGNGKVRLASDTTALSDHLVNGDFSVNYHDQWKNTDWTSIDPNNGRTLIPWKWYAINGWDKAKFAWLSTQKAGSYIEQKANAVELQYDAHADNMYAELCAYEAGTAIYQDLKTVPGTLYKVRLKHASLSSAYLDKMQVMIGAPGHETPVEMTRTTVNGHGDKLNEKSTTIATKATNGNDRDHGDQWETYEGTYIIPANQTVTRFTFKSVDARSLNRGNALDDIVFDKAYRLSYDKNASDASGSVPSNERGKENTVQPAKAKTTGTLRLASDDDVAAYAASNLPEQIVNDGFDYPSVPSWTTLSESGSNKYNKGKLFATINPGTGKYGSGCAMSTTGRAIPNWNRSNFAWNSTQGDTHHSGGMSCEAGNVELNYDSVHHNQFGELTADQQGTAIYQDVKVTPGTMMKWSLKHSSATSAYVDKMQVMIGEPYKETAQEATRITSENGNKVGEKMTTISTPTTSDRADNKKWDTYSGTYLVPDKVTTVRFTFKSIASAEWYSGNDLDDIKFSRSYQLSYDKNAQDAAGSIPSDKAANTTRPAKSETDGKVSDLVQRTTTHEDGSVTVKTIDTSTDTVSGCQIYYPAGAKIRLATLAKDDDCWDSTMLTRPDVDGKKMKMLGWSESQYHDDNAGALSTITPTVTMPVGGKTVYAVWVSSGVTLTYNVNTPESITPPVTPNGITVPYNTVINDTSGWKAGSTTIIPGYRFLGWYTDPRDVIEPTDPRCEIYPNLDMCQPQTVPLYSSWGKALTADITVYAHWERADTQVMYDANGGKGSHAPTDGRQHSTITTPSDVSQSFSRDGYSFAGWNTKPDGSGVSYKDGDGVPVEDKVVTLYAQWRAKIFVMPEAGGEGGPSPLTVIPAVIAGLALMVGLAGTRRRFKASRQTGRHGR